MTYKTLKRNGEYVCRTNVPPLILTEIAYTDNKEQQKDFDTSVEEDLVSHSTISYFDASDLPLNLKTMLTMRTVLKENLMRYLRYLQP